MVSHRAVSLNYSVKVDTSGISLCSYENKILTGSGDGVG